MAKASLSATWPFRPTRAPPLALAALLLYQGASAARMLDLDSLRPVLLLPAPYPEIVAQRHALNGQGFYTPISGDQCWYAPFPCAPYLDSKLELRGETMEDGFRIRP